MTSTAQQMVTLSPYELAELLGVDRSDAALLSSAPVRLPAAFVESWRTRVGPLELGVAEISLLTGVPPRTLAGWCKSRAVVARRVVNRGPGHGYRVAPAALVEYLRKRNEGPAPVVAETPSQFRRRAVSVKEKLAAACGRRR